MTAVLVAIAFATSLLSGVFGMGGGMILMGVLLAIMPLAQAMVLHGAIQIVSNGARAVMLRRHIRWRILPGYVLGAALSAALFSYLALQLDAALAMIILGATPLTLALIPRIKLPSVLSHRGAFLCGVIVAASQLLVGVSGALLDIFFISTSEQDPDLDRYGVIATKAITQSIGHATKIIYFGLLIGRGAANPLLIGLAIAATLAGTRLGTRLLDHLGDRSFQRYSRVLIVAIACVFVVRGAMQW